MNINLEYIESQPFEVVGNGREIRLNCPNCDDTTKHLYVNMDRTLWYCFKCGKGGKVQHKKGTHLSADMFEESKLVAHVKNFISNKKQVELYQQITGKVIKSLPLNYQIRNIADGTPGGYLKSRGVNEDEIVKYDIRASKEKDGPYKNCIIFPIYEAVAHGLSSELELQYFVCRKYDNSKPKYVNAPWPKDDALFIASPPEMQRWNSTIIVEGIFDALAISRLGYRGIALLGKTATSKQLVRLVNVLLHGKYDNCFVYLDSDALTHAIQLKLQLNGLGITTRLVRQDNDAADLYMKEPRLLKEAIEYALKH